MSVTATVATAMMAGEVLNTIKDLLKNLKAAEGNTSLTEITKVARVEPLTIIGRDCINLEYLPEVMQSLQSLFSGYYLQALALTTTLSSVKVGKILGRLNPNSDPGQDIYNKVFESYKDSYSTKPENFNIAWRMCAETYTYRLPKLDEKVALEAANPTTGYNFRADLTSDINSLSNLAVGKLLNVVVKEGNQSVELPISIRLVPSQVPENTIVDMLTRHNVDTTLAERFHAWRAGRISFVKDLILCQDLIDQQKRAMMNDKEGAFSEVIARSNNSKVSYLFNGGDLNMATASNLYVISKNTQEQLEEKLGGKLSSVKIREHLFKSGYMMILAIIDPMYERVTFYHRGINTATSVGIRDIKIANKGSGPDIGDILKAYQLGNSPSW